MNRKNKFNLLLKYLTVVAGVVIMVSSTVQAQQPGAPSTGDSPHGGNTPGMENKKELQQKIMELRQLQKEQQKIQQEVLQKNPELKQQEEDLREVLQETMAENLASEDIDIENLKSMQTKLQEGNMTSEEKSELEAKFQQKVEGYKKARTETLNNPEVREKREALIEGIEEESPRVKKISQKLEELEQEIRESFARSQQH